ncbi:MAG: NAD-dependent succinate-semialdehyde dehydrogenase [Agarilytica sp.]
MMLKNGDLLKTNNYIAGAWQSAPGGKQFPVLNPANGSVIAQVADATQQDCHTAIESAHQAFLKWKHVSGKERSGILRAWFDEIQVNAEDLALLMTLEQGKPIRESRAEIQYGASYIEWFSEEAKRIYGDLIPANTTDKRIMVMKQPVGVVAAITPWNFPNAMIARKAAPAIAAGCSFVVKPASQTPLSALALAACADRAGLPKGLFSVVCSANAEDVGHIFCSHPQVKKISFTGSTHVGKTLIEQSAATVKRCSMELGGNAPFIVFEDADLDAAVSGLMASKFRNAGQTCVCANRVFVHADVYEKFSDKLIKAVQALKVGEGIGEDSDIGPLIDSAAKNKITVLCEDAQKRGALIVETHTLADDTSLFVSPKVVKGAKADFEMCQNEIFGPVVPLIVFESEAEVIALANDSNYGLASYFYTQDLSRSWRVSEALEYGMVGINEGIISAENAPFGGVKESGFGREGSKYGLDDYLSLKYVCSGGL